MPSQQTTDSMIHGYQVLTEKEKETLRLLLAGHDAKSSARSLGLSVHTINERLRDARRKLSVSSSKEAARLLRECEKADPEKFADKTLRDAEPRRAGQHIDQPHQERRTKRRVWWAVGGFVMMSVIVAALAMLAPAQSPQASVEARGAVAIQPGVAESAVTKAARDWLALVDEEKWNDSWAATGQSFRSSNTVDAWRSASENARVPLGRVVSRALASVQSIPAPPNGYRMVRFHTDFTNKRGATETLSLNREGDSWKVVGFYIE